MLRTFKHKYQYFVTVQVDGELRNIAFDSYNPVKTRKGIKNIKQDLIEYTSDPDLVIMYINQLS